MNENEANHLAGKHRMQAQTVEAAQFYAESIGDCGYCNRRVDRYARKFAKRAAFYAGTNR